MDAIQWRMHLFKTEASVNKFFTFFMNFSGSLNYVLEDTLHKMLMDETQALIKSKYFLKGKCIGPEVYVVHRWKTHHLCFWDIGTNPGYAGLGWLAFFFVGFLDSCGDCAPISCSVEWVDFLRPDFLNNGLYTVFPLESKKNIYSHPNLEFWAYC